MSERRRNEQEGHTHAGGGRKVDVLVVLALLLPVLVTVSVAWLDGDDRAPGTEPPTPSRLTQLSVVCPSPVEGRPGDVQVTRVPGVDGGKVGVRVASRSGKLEAAGNVAAGDRLTTVPESKSAAVVLNGKGAAAPGLVAGRAEPGAAAECREPWYDEWFVGLGAAAKQSSVIELTNPDNAPAVVNIEIVDKNGPVDDAARRGITVPGHTVQRIDLAERPVRTAVSAHLTVTRGRIAATARHTYDALGRATPTTDYVPSQAQPDTRNLLLGVPEQGEQRRLFLTNPGDDEVRASVKVVTPSSTFATSGTREIAVPPQSVSEVPLESILDSLAAAGALGVQIDSTGPVLAGARALVGGDLMTVGPATSYDEPSVSVLPTGAKKLVLAGATRTGLVRVTAAAADGKLIWDEKRFEVAAERATSVVLPERAVQVTVEARNTPIAGTVVTEEGGTGTLRLQPSRVFSDVPAVRPAS